MPSLIYRCGLSLALVGSACVVNRDLADSFGIIKIAVAMLGAVVLLVHWYDLRRTSLDAPIAATAAAIGISWAYSLDHRVGMIGVYGQPFHGLAAIIPAVVIFYVVASHRRRWPDGPYICAAVIAIANGLVCAAQLAGLVAAPFDTVSGRAIGLFGSPVFLGAVMAVCVPASMMLALRGSKLGLIGIAGGFMAITACGSRGPWIALAVSGLASMAASGRYRPRLAHIAGILAVAGILAIPTIGKLNSDSGRLMTWGIAARAGMDHPVMGWGPDTFALANRALKTPASVAAVGDRTIQASAHNDLLQAWATTGILGLLALIWLWTAVLRIAWPSPFVFCSVVALFVVAKFNPVPPSAYYIAAALVGSVVATSARTSRWLWGACAVAFIVVWPRVGKQYRGESLHSQGNILLRQGNLKRGADMLRGANELVPTDINYANARIMLLIRLSSPDIESPRREFAKRALRVAAAVVVAHPNDPSAYELMSTAEIFAAQMFGPGLARAALLSARRAVVLDPLMDFSLVRLGQAAMMTGDVKQARATAERIRMVRSLKK